MLNVSLQGKEPRRQVKSRQKYRCVCGIEQEERQINILCSSYFGQRNNLLPPTDFKPPGLNMMTGEAVTKATKVRKPRARADRTRKSVVTVNSTETSQAASVNDFFDGTKQDIDEIHLLANTEAALEVKKASEDAESWPAANHLTAYSLHAPDMPAVIMEGTAEVIDLTSPDPALYDGTSAFRKRERSLTPPPAFPTVSLAREDAQKVSNEASYDGLEELPAVTDVHFSLPTQTLRKSASPPKDHKIYITVQLCTAAGEPYSFKVLQSVQSDMSQLFTRAAGAFDLPLHQLVLEYKSVVLFASATSHSMGMKDACTVCKLQVAAEYDTDHIDAYDRIYYKLRQKEQREAQEKALLDLEGSNSAVVEHDESDGFNIRIKTAQREEKVFVALRDTVSSLLLKFKTKCPDSRISSLHFDGDKLDPKVTVAQLKLEKGDMLEGK